MRKRDILSGDLVEDADVVAVERSNREELFFFIAVVVFLALDDLFDFDLLLVLAKQSFD